MTVHDEFWLSGFGTARADGQPVTGTAVTPDPSGDWWYQAPEMLAGSPRYCGAVDVWAAGCILGELLGQ